MPVPTSGAISLANLQTELEGVTAGANAASLNEFYAGGSFVTADSFGYLSGVQTAIPSSGAISLSNFYGAKWLGGITYEYTTAGTYTVTIPNKTGFINNYQWSVFLVGGGGGGGGAHGSTAPNRDPIGSGGGGGGGNHTNASGTNSSASSLTFTVVVGPGGTGGASSTAANPYTPTGTAGGTGGTTSLAINGTVVTSIGGGGGGGGGSINPDVAGTAGTSTTAYPGTAGTISENGSAPGGNGGQSVLAYGENGSSSAATTAGIHGAGGAGGGGSGGNIYSNGSAGGPGYARVTFKNEFSFTTSQTFTTPTASGTFTVPAGIYQIYTNCVGGGGAQGAAGGLVEALISVTPGEVLTVRVGGAGAATTVVGYTTRSEEHTSELQSRHLLG
jgi:hypothetical protein